MPLKRYGVLKGRPIRRMIGQGSSPHYQIHIIDETVDYRIAVNVKSKESPSELEYLVEDEFHHPVTAGLPGLPLGFTSLQSQPGGLALDRLVLVPNPVSDPEVLADPGEPFRSHTYETAAVQSSGTG